MLPELLGFPALPLLERRQNLVAAFLARHHPPDRSAVVDSAQQGLHTLQLLQQAANRLSIERSEKIQRVTQVLGGDSKPVKLFGRRLLARGILAAPEVLLRHARQDSLGRGLDRAGREILRCAAFKSAPPLGRRTPPHPALQRSRQASGRLRALPSKLPRQRTSRRPGLFCQQPQSDIAIADAPRLQHDLLQPLPDSSRFVPWKTRLQHHQDAREPADRNP
jgi:hypothetical protein